ncbi:MAG: transketolase, partial [Geobacteraceae bacterium]
MRSLPGCPSVIHSASASPAPPAEAMPTELKPAATKKFFGFPEDQSFYVPEDALANWREAGKRGAGLEAEWNKLFAGYKAEFPELAAEFERTQAGRLKAGWEKAIPSFPVDKPVATRNAGQVVMNAIYDSVPELFGGAADLTASTKTIFKA